MLTISARTPQGPAGQGALLDTVINHMANSAGTGTGGSSGDVQEFAYGRALKRVFSGEKLAYLKNFGEAWGYVPSTYKDGAAYTLAHVFMLAWPYGSPDVHSGYAFDNDAGGPDNGQVDACHTDGWKCQHAGARSPAWSRSATPRAARR